MLKSGCSDIPALPRRLIATPSSRLIGQTSLALRAADRPSSAINLNSDPVIAPAGQRGEIATVKVATPWPRDQTS
jgi:hypothetical protein